MSKFTPGPWGVWRAAAIHSFTIQGLHRKVARIIGNDVEGDANARLIASAPDLLAIAHCYAAECGECGGTRVMPDGEPCDECAFIWKVISAAEGPA